VIGERDLQRRVDRPEPELVKNTWSSPVGADGHQARRQLEHLGMAHLNAGA
jgi:hypothetical protein